MNVCVCVSECVRSICFPSYIHTRSCPLQFSHTYTNTHTCHLCHFWCVQLAWPPVFPPQVPDCVPVCLPGLCVRLFIFLPVCLPALWSQATRAFLFYFFNCFLPPTGPKYREAQQCSLCLESVDREKETEFVPTLHNQSSILYVFIHIIYFNLRTLVHFQSGWATYKSKASSYLQLSHLCSGE